MKKFTFWSVLFVILIISGCNGLNNNNTKVVLSGDKPPSVLVETADKTYETTLGSYCWEHSKGTVECVDTAGPVDLLKDKEPIQIRAGEDIKMNMDYTPKPNKMHLTQVMNDDEKEIEINDHQFTAPDEKGTYFYSYGVWWIDEDVEDLSHGSASYAFSLEVK